MTQINEYLYFGDVGSLFVYDVRFNPHDRAHCNPLPDGRVQLRLTTEPGFRESFVIYNDGAPHALKMHLMREDSRFAYWEVFIRPEARQLHYSFALKRRNGRSFYFGGRGMTHAVETPFRLDLERWTPFTTPEWMQGALLYQIFPERFANGEPSNDPPGTKPWGSPPKWREFQGGDLQGITQHLDYIQELGIEVLYLNPINTAPSNYKYDAVDFYHVDPAFGGDAAFRELVDAAHARDMRVIIDASFNHCHPQFPPFQDILANGADSKYVDWFTINEFPVEVRLRPHLMTPEQKASANFQRYFDYVKQVQSLTGIPLRTVEDSDGPLVEPTYLAWYGVLNMPKINQRNPETRAYFLDVAAHWIREFDIDGWRMDVAQFVEDEFWEEFRRVCKSLKPDCYLLSEIWGDTSHWLQGDKFDATMNYLFRDLCIDYCAKQELSTAEVIDGLSRLEGTYAPQVHAVNQNLLSSHDTPRFLNLCGEDKERFKLGYFLQLTMPGAPCIYYGDEIGMSGGGDPDCRGAFPWHDRASWDEELLAWFKKLIALRQKTPALKRGGWQLVWWGEEAFAFERPLPDSAEKALVVVNRGEAIPELTLPVEGTSNVRLLWGDIQLSYTGGSQLVLKNIPASSGVIVAVRE